MMRPLIAKFCTGFMCTPDKLEDCYLYDPKPANPFDGFSPRSTESGECPYYHPKSWGEGPEVVE